MKKLIVIVSCFALSNLCLAQSSDSIFDKDKETIINYFKEETIGGKLDFEKDFGIFLWGQAIKRTNQFSKKKAARFWEEIQGRKLSKAEKKAFHRGFNATIE